MQVLVKFEDTLRMHGDTPMAAAVGMQGGGGSGGRSSVGSFGGRTAQSYSGAHDYGGAAAAANGPM